MLSQTHPLATECLSPWRFFQVVIVPASSTHGIICVDCQAAKELRRPAANFPTRRIHCMQKSFPLGRSGASREEMSLSHNNRPSAASASSLLSTFLIGRTRVGRSKSQMHSLTVDGKTIFYFLGVAFSMRVLLVLRSVAGLLLVSHRSAVSALYCSCCLASIVA